MFKFSFSLAKNSLEKNEKIYEITPVDHYNSLMQNNFYKADLPNQKILLLEVIPSIHIRLEFKN